MLAAWYASKVEAQAKNPGCLVEIDTGRVFPLASETVTVGRLDPRTGIRPDIDLADLDPERSISRRHAVIRRSAAGHCAVIDEKGAMNGTYLNGVRLPQGQLHPLKVGDFIVFGLVGFRVEAARAEAPAPVAAPVAAVPAESPPPSPPTPAPAGLARAQAAEGAAARPSFAFGLNENVEVDGKTYHTQTEDLGWEAEEILTIVYTAGSILMSKKTPYSFFYERLGADTKPAEMVRFQHRGMVLGIKRGKVLARPGRAPGEHP